MTLEDSTACVFFFSSRRRHTRWPRDWSSDVCSSDAHSIESEEAIPVLVFLRHQELEEVVVVMGHLVTVVITQSPAIRQVRDRLILRLGEHAIFQEPRRTRNCLQKLQVSHTLDFDAEQLEEPPRVGKDLWIHLELRRRLEDLVRLVILHPNATVPVSDEAVNRQRVVDFLAETGEWHKQVQFDHRTAENP